jgi:hypothetical protein
VWRQDLPDRRRSPERGARRRSTTSPATGTYQGTENGLKMSDQNGNSYDAKFDGKEYPINGDPGNTMVSLKRIGNDTIEETDKRDGKVVGISRMTVSKDGKSIHIDYTNKLQGTTTSFDMEKQS